MRGKKCNEHKKGCISLGKYQRVSTLDSMCVRVCVEPSLVPHGHLSVYRGWGYSYSYNQTSQVTSQFDHTAS